MNTLLKKSLQDVTRRKLRATLTIFGILLGVLGLTALNTASNQISAGFLYTASAASLPDIQLSTTPAPATLAMLLQQQPNVRQVEAQSNLTARWVVPTGHLPLNIVGIQNFQSVPFNSFSLLEGHVPGPGEILMEGSDRGLMTLHVGDHITVEVHGTNQQLIVSGLARTQGLLAANLASVGRAYMGESELETLFQQSGVNQFLVRLDRSDTQSSHTTLQQLLSLLGTQHVTALQASLGSNLSSNTTKTNTLLEIIGSISIISLLLSVFLLISTISTLISEQFPIIGTMKALGGSRGQIMRSYLTTVAIYACIGTLLGIGLGILSGSLLTAVLSDWLNLEMGPLNLAPSIFLISALVGLGVPLLAALLPVILGTRITVHQALNGYGLEQNSGQRNGAGHLKNVLPQTIQLGLHSLGRRKARTLMTLSGLAATGIVFLAVLSGLASLSASTDQLASTYHFDTWATFQQAVPYRQIQQVLATVSGIRRMEPEASASVQTKWGSGILEGLKSETQIYQINLVAGHWFTPGEVSVVVINQHMAELAGLHVGSTLEVRNALYSANWQIIGIVQDNNGIAPGTVGSILTSLEQVNTFNRLAPDMTNQVRIQASDTRSGAIDGLATRVDNALSRLNTQETTQTAQQAIAGMRSEQGLIAVLLFIAVAIVALVGAMSLFNTLAMGILERQREIGILRSMGARDSKIIAVFWSEGTALGLLAWLVALLLGLPAAYGFVQLLSSLLAPLPFTFSLFNALIMLLMILLIATLASIGPALAASRIKIAQTLRYE
jgi:putative ABC transport system permease protein